MSEDQKPQNPTTVPANYWSTARHCYFRDHETMTWGVADVTDHRILSGVDKSIAAAIACLLNGDVAVARLFLDGLPDKMS